MSPCIAQTPGIERTIELNGDAGGRRFDGIGVVDGGGATSVLLKDYPEPQRSQILDLIFKPKFGASVSALLVEIPGDGNATQGSMPSHMHTRDDLNFHRGYTWWILQEAKERNPNLTLTGMAWSAPGWIGAGNFWSQDAADYYVKWLTGLRSEYGLEFNAIGMRNEKGVSFDLAKRMRSTLTAQGFGGVKLQGFDNWPADKLEPFQQMMADPGKRDALDILSAHTLIATPPHDGDKLRQWSEELKKPVWNSEEHVYKDGFDCEISIVRAFNLNYIRYAATLVVNWYGIAAVYPMEPFSEKPAALLARSPWSGAYYPREALWGYAHYGQFSAPGWQYLNGGYGELASGGSFVTLKSPQTDYSIIAETKDATVPQRVRFRTGHGLSDGELHVWLSNAQNQFVQQRSIKAVHGDFTITLAPHSIYSLTTTSGQRKGAFRGVPQERPFPFPFYETYEEYSEPARFGYLPRYMADIEEVFEIANRPDGKGKALRQVVASRPIEWAPEWQPYSIIGDEHWTNYEVSADVFLNPGDSAGVMGRVNDVGKGYGTIPKGYFLELSDDGMCRLVVVRGKVDKKALVGDAEQQAEIHANQDVSAGGELLLGSKQLPGLDKTTWHSLKLSFQGTSISGFVDGVPVLRVDNALYSHGMAGLIARGGQHRLSTPYFDNLLIGPQGGRIPEPNTKVTIRTPIYQMKP